MPGHNCAGSADGCYLTQAPRHTHTHTHSCTFGTVSYRLVGLVFSKDYSLCMRGGSSALCASGIMRETRKGAGSGSIWSQTWMRKKRVHLAQWTAWMDEVLWVRWPRVRSGRDMQVLPHLHARIVRLLTNTVRVPTCVISCIMLPSFAPLFWWHSWRIHQLCRAGFREDDGVQPKCLQESFSGEEQKRSSSWRVLSLKAQHYFLGRHHVISHTLQRIYSVFFCFFPSLLLPLTRLLYGSTNIQNFSWIFMSLEMLGIYQHAVSHQSTRARGLTDIHTLGPWLWY